MQSRTHTFDGVYVDGDTEWLDKKQQRRETSDLLVRDSLDARRTHANNAAKNFLEDLSRRAQLRSGIERKSQEAREQQQQELKRQADQYRERLRSKLRPELRDPG